jgi:hypothetical protein
MGCLKSFVSGKTIKELWNFRNGQLFREETEPNTSYWIDEVIECPCGKTSHVRIGEGAGFLKCPYCGADTGVCVC